MNVWDFVNSINFKKDDIYAGNEKVYVPFLINKSLSYFVDTILFANEANINSHIDPKLQYDFLRTIVSKKKRFSKWHKAAADNTEVVKRIYKISSQKAAEIVQLLNNQQLDMLKDIDERRHF